MSADGNKEPLLSRDEKLFGSLDSQPDVSIRSMPVHDTSSQSAIQDSIELDQRYSSSGKNATGERSSAQTPDEEATETSVSNFFFLQASSSDGETDGLPSSGCEPDRIYSWEQTLLFTMDEVDGIKAEPSTYIRVSACVSDDHLKKHYRECWKKSDTSEIPELAITFLGGCDEDLLSEDVKKSLKDCISNILGKLNCLLITRATNIGITKVIGKICSIETLEWNYGYMSKSIGIIPWHLVKGREELKHEENAPGTNYDVPYAVRDQAGQRDWALDPNQHHFYLVDEGNHTMSGVEIEFLSKINRNFCEDLIPCVMILTGGGKTSLRIMYKALFLAQDVKPVVILMRGSGKLADLLCDTLDHLDHLDHFDHHDQEQIDQEQEAAVYRFLETKDCGYLTSDSFVDAKKMICECVTKRKDQIFTFGLKFDAQNDDLQTVLFRAAMKAAEKIPINHFLFAANLGDIKVAKQLSRDENWLDYRMMDSLIMKSNSLARIKELLETYEFNVRGYIKDQLTGLYKIPYKRSRVAASEFYPNELMDFFQRRYTYRDCNLMDVNNALKDLSFGNVVDDTHNTVDRKIEINKEVINPVQALLINSVLYLDVNAAKLFWHFDQYNPLSNALLVYTLLNGIKRNVKHVSKSPQNDFEGALRYFETRMCCLLDEYFKTSKEMTEKVLTSKILLWRDHTLLEVAGDIGQKSFIEKPGSQAVLEKQWCEADALKRYAGMFGKPKFKFGIHLAIYILTFIAFAVYFVSFNKISLEPLKWIVMVVVISLTLDEIRQVKDVGKGFYLNIKQWAHSLWNILDALAILLFFTGFGLSYYNNYASDFILRLYLCVSCFKILQFFSVWKPLGVYMFMIGKMLLRMKTFMFVIFVSILAYGLFMTSMLHPNLNFDGVFLFSIFFRPYLMLVGEPGIESFELNNSTTVFGTDKVSTTSEISVVVAMAAFLLFGNILLMNLLIADFNQIHGDVLSRSEETWRYEQFILLQEFKKKPLLPIPFSIPENLYQLFKTRTHVGHPSVDRRKIADFEKFCFKKCFPKIPDTFDNDSQ